MDQTTAEGRAMYLFTQVKMGDIPEAALLYLAALNARVGFCGEVCLTAYAHYAQAVEGLPCTDDLYILHGADEELFWRAQQEWERFEKAEGKIGFRRRSQT